MRNGSEWTFGVRDLEKGELWSGYVKNVVDADTIDVSFNTCGVQRIRLVGINAPEIGEEGYEEAKEFVTLTPHQMGNMFNPSFSSRSLTF